jgi:hypothetical protein
METSAVEESTSTANRKRPQSVGHEGADNSSVGGGARANAGEENGGSGLDNHQGSLCPPPTKRATTASVGSPEEENGSSSEQSELEEHAPGSNRTAKSNRWAMTHFCRWLEDHNECHPEDPIPVDLLKRHKEPELLNKWLARYADEARRLDGKPYPATSVYFLLAALVRQMRSKDPSAPNFLTSSNIQFKPLHDSLESTFRRLREEVPNEPKNPPSLTHEEEERLWSSGALSCNSPRGLVRAVYFLNVKHLGMTGGSKHRLLKLSQFKRLNNPPCYVYSYTESSLSVFEKGTNSATSVWTRKRSESSQSSVVRTVTLNAAPEKGSRCYVYVLDNYLQRIPPEALAKDTFYLQPLGHTLANVPHVWYSLNPMGKNALSRLVKEICSEAGITGARNLKGIKNSAGHRGPENIEPSAVATTGVSPQQGSMVLSPQIVIPPLSFLMQGAMQVPPLPSPTTETPTTPVNWAGEVSLASLTQLSQKINQRLQPIAPKLLPNSVGQQSTRRQRSQPVNTGQTPPFFQGGVTHHPNAAPNLHLNLQPTATTTSTINATNSTLPRTPTPTQPHTAPSNRPLPPQSLSMHRSTQTLPQNARQAPDEGKSTTPQRDPNHRSSPQPPMEDSGSPGPTEQQETQSIHLPPPACSCQHHHGAPQQLTFNNCHVTIYLTPLQPPPNP